MALVLWNPETGGDIELYRGQYIFSALTTYTISAWFRKTDVSRINDTLFCPVGRGSTSNQIRLMVSNGSVVLRENEATYNAVTAAVAKNNTWHHALGMRNGTTKYAFIDAGNYGTYVGGGTCTGGGDMAIGAAGATDSGMEGMVAECAAWNTNLNTDEIWALAKGVNPINIRKDNLRFYMPLRAECQGLCDLMGQRFLYAFGSAARPGPRLSQSHPPLAQRDHISSRGLMSMMPVGIPISTLDGIDHPINRGIKRGIGIGIRSAA